jgi:hypothetical protein
MTSRPNNKLMTWQKCALALLLVSSTSCASANHGYWSFTATRTVYGNGGPCLDETGAEAALIIALLPLAIDLIVLPVTLIHDACCE